MLDHAVVDYEGKDFAEQNASLFRYNALNNRQYKNGNRHLIYNFHQTPKWYPLSEGVLKDLEVNTQLMTPV